MKSLYDELMSINGVLDVEERYLNILVEDISALEDVDEVMSKRGYKLKYIDVLHSGFGLVYGA